MTKEHIVVDPIYFDNIKTVIESMNKFFESNFKVKEFPTTQPMEIGIIINSLCWFDDLEPALLEDPSKFIQVVEDIKVEAEKCDERNIYAAWMKDERQELIDQVRAVVAVKFLQHISSHFDEFNNLINGVYTLKLYLQPSMYRREIELFKTFPLDEIDFMFEGSPWTLFDQSSFINEIFDNKYIHLPSSLKVDDEIQRFTSGMDIDDSYQIVIDQTVQEAAEVNYFTDIKPKHIKYDEKTKKFHISKQFRKIVDDLITALEKCNTSDDLKNEGQKGKDGAFSIPNKFTDTVLPFILAKVYNNNKKYVESNFGTEGLSKYINSYKSIGDKNNGAKRFINYDLYSTFKTDKEGTIKFLKDFLTLELVNDESCAIVNNTLLTLFNIFDSRIYLDILYNLIPAKVKKEEYPTEDGFVKQIRGRINQNSRQTNVYKDDTSKQNEEAETSEEIVEYVNDCLKEFGDMSITDMQYCEQYSSLLHDEIKCIPDIMYNKGISPIKIDKYIGESYNVFQEGLFTKLREKKEAKREAQLREEAARIEGETGKKFAEEFIDQLINGWYDEIFINSYTLNRNYLSYSSKIVDEGDRILSKCSVPNGVNKENLYPIAEFNSDEQLRDFFSEYRNCRLFSDGNGIVYSNAHTKNHNELIKVFGSIKAFHRNIDETQIYMNNPNHVLKNQWYGEDDESIDIPLTFETKNGMVSIYSIMYLHYACFDNPDEDFSMILNPEATRLTKLFKTLLNPEDYRRTETDSESYGEFLFRLVKNKKVEFKGITMPNIKGIPTSNQTPMMVVSFVVNKHKINIEYNKLRECIRITDNSSGVVTESYVCQNLQVDPGGSKIKQKSFNIFEEEGGFVQEQEMGGIPDYMKNRINISDENGDTPKVNITDVQIPPDMPTNSMDSLIDSIDNKLETGGDSYDTMLGSGYHDTHPDAGKNKSGGIVYNITNNYTNSFNHDSHNQKTLTNNNNDLSTGKTTTTHIHNNNSHNNTNNSSKRNAKGNKGVNNNNNGSAPVDSHGSSNANKDENKTFSNGKTIQEVFAFLESNEEPLSVGNDAGEPPKEDLLTKAMDMDRNTLSVQQTAKQKVQKVINTGKAILKPVSRTKQWLTKMIDSLIKRDEDKVKAEIIENRSYRTALYKGMRIALKLGLTGVAFTISGYLGIAYAGIQVAKIADKQRLKKEVQEEFTTELEILDDKIRRASEEDTPESRKAKYQMMRLRSKMQRMALDTPHQIVKSPYSIV